MKIVYCIHQQDVHRDGALTDIVYGPYETDDWREMYQRADELQNSPANTFSNGGLRSKFTPHQMTKDL